MRSSMAKFIIDCGGYVETYRGLYVYDEDSGEVKYIEKDKFGTPEAESSWKVIDRENPGGVMRRRWDIPYKNRNAPTIGRTVVFTDDPMTEEERLLAMLEMSGGEFETQLYRYRLDLENRTMLRIEKRLYHAGKTGPENWYIMGFFTVEE